MRNLVTGAEVYDVTLREKNKYSQIKQTLGATYTMDADMPHWQFLDPGGAARTILLPPEAQGLWFMIVNQADANEDLTINEDSNTTTIGVLSRGGVGLFYCDGTTWYGSGGVGGQDAEIQTTGNSEVQINSRNYTAASGDAIAFQAVPNQTVDTTGEVFGGQIKPRTAAGVNAATVNGLGIDSEVKSGDGVLTGDLRGLNVYLGSTGSGTIGGNIVGLRLRAESNINPTGHIVAMHIVQHEGSQGWDGLVKFAEALGTHSMTTNTDKTGNAKSGTIKVIANNTEYHIQLYAAA